MLVVSTSDIVLTAHGAIASKRRSAYLATALALVLLAIKLFDPALQWTGRWIFVGAILAAAVPVYQRARRFAARRLAWSLLLAAALLTALAGGLYGRLPGGTNPFAPPNGNLILATMISVAAMGFVGLLVKASLRVLDTVLLIDALVAGLSVASLLALLYMRRILTPMSIQIIQLDHHENLIIASMLLIMIIGIVTATSMVDVTKDQLFFFVMAAAIVASIGEVIANYDVHHATTHWGAMVDACWIGAYVLVGEAAFRDDGTISEPGGLREHRSDRNQSRKIAVNGVLALSVTVLAVIYHVPPVVGGLALGALGVMTVRLLVSLRLERVQSTLFEELAVTDALTGLANRRRLVESTTPHWDSHGEGRGGVLIVDLDNFKEVNDSLGHRAGDLVLIELSRRLKSALGARGLLARLGGDEFAVTASDLTTDELVALARELESLVREPIVVEELLLHLSASFGVATRATVSDTQEELFRKADVAMYRAKEKRSGVEHYDFEHDRNDPDRLRLYGLVSQAVRAKSFEVYLQPIVEVASGQVTGCEALARWSPDGYGPIPPDRFIPMIELQGLIVPFTTHILRQSITQVLTLDRLGELHGLSVNVSERDFVNSDFPDMVRGVLSDFDFPPERLTIEITEGVFANDDVKVSACILLLRAMGVRISIDDFGTGYSALSKLVDFPVDELKIDRSFVAVALTNSRAEAVVRASIELARAMDVTLVAEGVEDEATYRFLANLGVKLIQGFHVARPMPIAECVKFIADFHHDGYAIEVDRT